MTNIRVTRQTQTEHLGDFFTLRSAIAVRGGEIEVSQRLEDSQRGYAIGKFRVDLIVLAMKASEHILFGEQS